MQISTSTENQLGRGTWVRQYQSKIAPCTELRHICPLQLQVIERAIKLWSAEGDVVLSPFMGIGSEGYMALKMNRKFRGFELKKSYYELAKRNLETAVDQFALAV